MNKSPTIIMCLSNWLCLLLFTYITSFDPQNNSMRSPIFQVKKRGFESRFILIPKPLKFYSNSYPKNLLWAIPSSRVLVL